MMNNNLIPGLWRGALVLLVIGLAIPALAAAGDEEPDTGRVKGPAASPDNEPAAVLDGELAARYQSFFAAFSGKETASALQMIAPADLVAALRAGEPLFVLDVRTPGEAEIAGITCPASAAVPMNRVFEAENLARLPGEGKIVVVCTAGHRATAVALALRHVGFRDVWILKGGLAALSAHLTPKTAY